MKLEMVPDGTKLGLFSNTFSKYFVYQMGLFELLKWKAFRKFFPVNHRNVPQSHIFWLTVIERRNQRNFYEGSLSYMHCPLNSTNVRKHQNYECKETVGLWPCEQCNYHLCIHNEMQASFASFVGIIKMYVLYMVKHAWQFEWVDWN